MKQLTFALLFLFGLISCQKSTNGLKYVKEIKLPYVIKIENVEQFVSQALERKPVFNYNEVSKIIGHHTNVSKVYFLGKFSRNQNDYILYQDVTPNESAEFFPAIYLIQIHTGKTLSLTPHNEETFIDQVIIEENKITIRENYWSTKEKKRKNDKIKEYKFDFSEIIKENKPINSISSTGIDNLPLSSDLKGLWAVNCANELTELDINKDEGFLSLYDFNAIYIKIKVEKLSNENAYLLKYASVSSQQDYYENELKIVDEDIDKSKPIGKLILLENGKARLEWVGLYNLKKQKLEFVANDFLFISENGGKLPLILERCD